MKEKERYKLESYHEAFCQIHDTESNEWYLRKDLVTDLLNQQDARIKELEEALKKANTNNYLTDYYLIEKENQQLKDQVKKNHIKKVYYRNNSTKTWKFKS